MGSEERKKELNKLRKDELIDKLIQSEELERRLNTRIDKLESVVGSLIDKFEQSLIDNFEQKSEPTCDFKNRLVQVERNLFLSDQYERRDCVELVGIPDNVQQKDLENVVIDAFAVAGVTVVPRDFQACHRLKNKSTVIAKMTNRKDVQSLLIAKKLLREPNDEGRKKLNIDAGAKIYVNESLCGPFRYLLGKCNALYKRKQLAGFWTRNGCIKIKLNSDNSDDEGAIVSISHIEDLHKIFGSDVVESLFKPRY